MASQTRTVIDTILGMIDAGKLHPGDVIAEDALLAELDADRLHQVLSVKIDGARNLAALADAQSVRHLWFYSSVAGRFGNPWQAPYATANRVLDAMARDRRAQGKAAEDQAKKEIGVGDKVGYKGKEYTVMEMDASKVILKDKTEFGFVPISIDKIEELEKIQDPAQTAAQPGEHAGASLGLGGHHAPLVLRDHLVLPVAAHGGSTAQVEPLRGDGHRLAVERVDPPRLGGDGEDEGVFGGEAKKALAEGRDIHAPSMMPRPPGFPGGLLVAAVGLEPTTPRL